MFKTLTLEISSAASCLTDNQVAATTSSSRRALSLHFLSPPPESLKYRRLILYLHLWWGRGSAANNCCPLRMTTNSTVSLPSFLLARVFIQLLAAPDREERKKRPFFWVEVKHCHAAAWNVAERHWQRKIPLNSLWLVLFHTCWVSVFCAVLIGRALIVSCHMCR